MTDTTLHFEGFSIDLSGRTLTVDGTPAALGARAFDVLVALAQRPQRVVAKSELLDLAWPGLVVEENNLQVQVGTLRRLLGAKVITTVPGRGYQLTLAPIGPVSQARADQFPKRSNNLPLDTTPFVGREPELAELQALLPQVTVLTLTGIGGAGKTRLALELARRAGPDFIDGVRYVDLAPLQDGDRLALSVAAAYGLSDDGQAPVVERLCERLAERQILLVLDNCEHLLSAAAPLVQALCAAAPGLTLLVTSREGLGVPGERLVAVRSMRCPAPVAGQLLDEVASYDAVLLFVERARAVMPQFALDEGNAQAVAEICRRLDGIPLAIELAAARTKVLSPEEIRSRLDDRFRLLAGGTRSMGRQQTLLAAIQWSHDQLSPSDQRVLWQLSVFVGGWTLEAAIAVTAAADEYALLDALSRLVDQSLISAGTQADGTSRYRMLESVRLFAVERLGDSGLAEATRNRHLAHFHALAKAAEPHLTGAGQVVWVERLRADFENLLAAHSWCDHGESFAEVGLELLVGIHMFLSRTGMEALGATLLARALSRPGAELASIARCRALSARGYFRFFIGRYEEMLADAQEAFALAETLRDGVQTAMSLWLSGLAHHALGELTLARAALERSLAIARSVGSERQLARALHSLAELSRSERRMEEAQTLNEEILVLHRASGRIDEMIMVLCNLALIALEQQEGERSVPYLHQAIELLKDTTSSRFAIALLMCAAGLAAYRAEWMRAAVFLGALRQETAATSYHIEPPDVPFVAAVEAQVRATLGEQEFTVAFCKGRDSRLPTLLAEIAGWLDLATASDPVVIKARPTGSV